MNKCLNKEKIYNIMPNKNCEKCRGTGMVKEANGTIHTCWKCLQEGQLEQHSKDVKDTGLRV